MINLITTGLPETSKGNQNEIFLGLEYCKGSKYATVSMLDYLKPLLGSDMGEPGRLEADHVKKILNQ